MGSAWEKKWEDTYNTGLSLEQIWKQHQRQKKDMAGHMTYLTGLAEQCSTVVEFGVRWGQSTACFLMGGADVVSYDLHSWKKTQHMFNTAMEGKPNTWTFIKGDSRYIDIPNCDILFIDTAHNGDVIFRELCLHHKKVKANGIIVMHDTEFCKEDGKHGAGMGAGIQQFLNEHPRWSIKAHFKHSFGLTVLERDW